MPALILAATLTVDTPTVSVEHPTDPIQSSRGEPIDVWVEPGQQLDAYAVHVRGVPGRVHVEQRLITSMTLDAGPERLSLITWKHHVSDYWPLTAQPGGYFQPTGASSAQFPPYEIDDLERAIQRDGGEGWLTTYRRGNATTSVAPSKLELRISAKVHQGWQVIQVVRFRLPTG